MAPDRRESAESRVPERREWSLEARVARPRALFYSISRRVASHMVVLYSFTLFKSYFTIFCALRHASHAGACRRGPSAGGLYCLLARLDSRTVYTVWCLGLRHAAWTLVCARAPRAAACRLPLGRRGGLLRRAARRPLCGAGWRRALSAREAQNHRCSAAIRIGIASV